MVFDARDVGKKITEIRVGHNLNQAEFANLMGVTKTTLGFYERGQRKPDTEFLYNLYKNFENVDLHWLITGEIQPAQKPKDLLDEGILAQVIDMSEQAKWIKLLTKSLPTYIKEFTETYEFLYWKKHKK